MKNQYMQANVFQFPYTWTFKTYWYCWLSNEIADNTARQGWDSILRPGTGTLTLHRSQQFDQTEFNKRVDSGSAISYRNKENTAENVYTASILNTRTMLKSFWWCFILCESNMKRNHLLSHSLLYQYSTVVKKWQKQLQKTQILLTITLSRSLSLSSTYEL